MLGRKPNRFIQQQRGFETVDKITNDEALKDSINKMVEAETLPTGHKQDGETRLGFQGKVTKPRIRETDNFKIEMFVDLHDEGLPFQAKVTDKKTGEIRDWYHAATEDELILTVAADVAEFRVEQQAAEVEQERLHPTQFADEEERIFCTWLMDFRFGQQYSEMLDLLPEGKWQEQLAWLFRHFARKMFGRHAFSSIKNLDAVWAYLLDAGSLNAFIKETDAIKKQQEAESVKNAERDRLAGELYDATEASYQRAVAADEQRKAVERFDDDKKLSKSKKGMMELRRKALFGSKENAFPVSKGTVARK